MLHVPGMPEGVHVSFSPEQLPVSAPAASALAVEDATLVAERRYAIAREAQERAAAALDRANDAVWAEIGPVPDCLFPSPDEVAKLTHPRWSPLLRQPLRWVRADNAPLGGMRQAWTETTIQKALMNAVDMFGRGGTTPNRIARWKALLPEVMAFDRRYAEIAIKHDLDLAQEDKRLADAELRRAESQFNASTATSLEGLGALVRHIGVMGIDKMPSVWLSLLLSAARLCNVDAGLPVFDVERWKAELESAGGGLCPATVSGSGGVYFPICYDDDERASVLARLSDEFDRNRPTIRLYIERMSALQ